MFEVAVLIEARARRREQDHVAALRVFGGPLHGALHRFQRGDGGGAVGFLTLSPQGQNQPAVATLNALDGAVTSNLPFIPSATSSICAFRRTPRAWPKSRRVADGTLIFPGLLTVESCTLPMRQGQPICG